ncbi:hypothetical protein [Oceanomicrobium pacificus]|uniref:DUF3325 domain-containing protein n=1 Tax=Oceanomicrobium pacificus TaxID=2692916 RepID=A0A6B0TWK2_9RHOB|nr:hypothetical protein [Oceanomicrobium pacificus]MXU65383.1 hypothetical protein [Oceanomicrobium pacificus]
MVLAQHSLLALAAASCAALGLAAHRAALAHPDPSDLGSDTRWRMLFVRLVGGTVLVMVAVQAVWRDGLVGPGLAALGLLALVLAAPRLPALARLAPFQLMLAGAGLLLAILFWLTQVT